MLRRCCNLIHRRKQVQEICFRVLSNFRETNFTIPAEKSSPVWSWNEWDPLEEVIVGTEENAVIPELTLEVKACINPNKWDFYRQYGGRRWADVVGKEFWKQISGDVQQLVYILEQEGVTVQRPDPFDFQTPIKTPDFESKGFYCAMPRDNILIIGDEIIEATMTWRSRFFEYKCYRRLILDYWRRGAMWTMAPKPQCNGQLFDQNYGVDGSASENYVTTEYEPCFDAADFIRAGKDVFVQRSQVTNESGIEWVRRHLQPRGIKVHTLHFHDPRPMHIDATFGIPKPGYVFQNPDRPCNEIDFFKSHGWKVCEVPKPHFPDDKGLWLGSKWLSMNTLMLDEKRVLVEKDEVGIQELFKKIGVTPIPVSMRHAYSIGGGIHCWTCDVRRNGPLQSYF